MAITKNRQSEETIISMAKRAFPNKQVVAIKELTEGMCNVTYDISFHDGSESILKIASKDKTGNITNEVNLMQAEVTAMKIAAESCSFKVADVQYYDTSNTICDSHYFFMEKIEGENFYLVKNRLSEDEIAKINTEIGKIAKKLTNVKNTAFGFLGEDTRYDSLYEFVKQMLKNLVSDAEKKKIDILYDEQFYLNEFEKDKDAFESVCYSTLVHWDMWEGNIFVKDGQVSGVIDWERALWGEPYMDDRFRLHSMCNHFLEGFGKTAFEKNERKRMRWYDIILYLTMSIEVFYREYETTGQYHWAREMLEKCMNSKV